MFASDASGSSNNAEFRDILKKVAEVALRKVMSGLASCRRIEGRYQARRGVQRARTSGQVPG
jgi:hypothetical protein